MASLLDSSAFAAAHDRGTILAASLRGAWQPDASPLAFDLDTARSVAPLCHGHGVGPLLWHRIRGTPLAATRLGEDLEEAAIASSIAVVVQQDALARTLSLLRAEGIEPILVKGLAVARLYPDPSHRPGGDLDFWIRPRDIERARAALRAAGYQPGYDVGIPFINPNNFATDDGVQIDIKTDFGFGVISPSLHRRWWARASCETLGGTRVRVLAPPDEIVYLSSHAAKHAFGSAKWLVDIAAALERWQTDVWGPPEIPAEQPIRSWTLVTLGLALDLLGANGEVLTPQQRRAALREAAPWRSQVLRIWGGGEGHSGQSVTLDVALTHIRRQPSPAGVWRLFRMLWPDAIEAAIYLRLPLRPAVAQPARALAFLHKRVWSPPQHLRAHLVMRRHR